MSHNLRNRHSCAANSQWLISGDGKHPYKDFGKDYQPDFDHWIKTDTIPTQIDTTQYIAQCENIATCQQDPNYTRIFTCKGKKGCASIPPSKACDERMS